MKKNAMPVFPPAREPILYDFDLLTRAELAELREDSRSAIAYGVKFFRKLKH